MTHFLTCLDSPPAHSHRHEGPFFFSPAASQKELTHVVDVLKAAGVPSASVRVQMLLAPEADPRDALLDHVAADPSDLLVMASRRVGAHGERPLRHEAVGSVAAYCMRNSDTPVLIVPAAKASRSRGEGKPAKTRVGCHASLFCSCAGGRRAGHRPQSPPPPPLTPLLSFFFWRFPSSFCSPPLSLRSWRRS